MLLIKTHLVTNLIRIHRDAAMVLKTVVCRSQAWKGTYRGLQQLVDGLQQLVAHIGVDDARIMEVQHLRWHRQYSGLGWNACHRAVFKINSVFAYAHKEACLLTKRFNMHTGKMTAVPRR
jgi:hypothetical protein